MLGGDEDDALWEAACAAHLTEVEAQLVARRATAPEAAADPAAAGDADADAASEGGEGGDGAALDDWRDDEWSDDDAGAGGKAAAAPYADALALDAADAVDSVEPAAKRVKQADLRHWFGGVPAPPPKPRVQSTLRNWLGVAPPAEAPAQAPPPRACPQYKRVVNTPFAVDAFTYGAVPGVTAYFLSHFHYDHYQGLTASWDAGPVYCSEVTAALVALRLRVRPELLKPLPMHTRVRVPGSACHVTLLEANHCPGAVLLLFESAGAPPDAPFTLHTGDFRAAASLRARPDVARLVGRIGTLYLDTTYADEVRVACFFHPAHHSLDTLRCAALCFSQPRACAC